MVSYFNITRIISLVICLYTGNVLAHTPTTAQIYAIAKYKKDANPLLKVAKKKATVGIVPYYVIKDKIYIFLGQELTGGKREAAGTYSDFGGSVTPDGKTILHHALREFTEETMGQMKLKEDEVINNGYLLYQKTDQDRDIYYIFVKFTNQQYQKTLKFHTAKVRLKASGVPNSYLEKEAFLWVRLEDLVPTPVPTTALTATTTETTASTETTAATPPTKTNRIEVPDNKRYSVLRPDGTTINILVRGYFLRDCLENPDLPSLIKKLK